MAYNIEEVMKGVYKLREEEDRKKAEQKAREETEKKLNAPQERSWQEQMYVDTEHPDTMSNGYATVLYIVVMIGSLIFKDFWLIWIAATFLWVKHITRRARRQQEWDKKQREKQKNDKIIKDE